MRFGLFGSVAAARRGSGEFDSSEGYRDFIDYNIEAEALGFHGTFVVEHHFTGFGEVSATINLLTWLGARTRTLRLGTAVMVLPWHNPVLLAEQAATLDLLSGGRLDFGIGSGYRYNEFCGFDVGMDEARRKIRRSIEIILKAWTSEERFSHRGKHWTFNDIIVEPPPARKPHPVVWMGAGNGRSIRDVARRGFVCYSVNMPRPMTWHTISPCSVKRWRRRARPGIRCGSASRVRFSSRKANRREEALDRRLANRVRQLKLATTFDRSCSADQVGPAAIRSRST